MKQFSLLLFVTLIMGGCALEKDYNQTTAQDYLENKKLYYIDDTTNSYYMYEFEGDQVIKNSYSDRDLKELNDIDIYFIDYNDSNSNIELRTRDNTYKCNFHIEENKEYMGLNCSSTFDNSTIFIGGYKDLFYAHYYK